MGLPMYHQPVGTLLVRIMGDGALVYQHSKAQTASQGISGKLRQTIVWERDEHPNDGDDRGVTEDAEAVLRGSRRGSHLTCKLASI